MGAPQLSRDPGRIGTGQRRNLDPARMQTVGPETIDEDGPLRWLRFGGLHCCVVVLSGAAFCAFLPGPDGWVGAFGEGL